MQGTAAAYDLAKYGDASRILLTDISLQRAQESAARVNDLVKRSVCEAAEVDASDEASVALQIHGFDVAISSVPYRLHATIERAALAAGTSVTDLGNDTDVTVEMLKLDDEFKAKDITLLPDTGLAPGLVNSLGVYMMESLDEVTDVKLYCGGLPQNPKPPFNYSLRFDIDGLVGEYIDEAIVLRDNEVVRLPTLEELEHLEIPGIGTMEAFTTSGGTSTAPWSFKGKVRNYDYKTLRYPGHCEQMRVFRDAGFWNEEPVLVQGQYVVPMQVFYKVMGDVILDPTDPDLVITHAIGYGKKDGEPVELQISVIDRQDPVTGFSAMERLTGFSASIMAIEVAMGNVRRGCVPYELAVSGVKMVEELERREISVIKRLSSREA